MILSKSLPNDLVAHVTAICGGRGDRWFEQLPGIISALEDRWLLSVKKPFPGIEFNFVAPAVLNDGSDAVVKISPPYERIEIINEAKYLQARQGQGCVQLLSVDREFHAILIERAVPGDALFKKYAGNPLSCIGPAIDVLRTIILPPLDDMTDVGTLDEWFANFRHVRETDFPVKYAEKAFEIYGRLATQAEHIYYLHGDYHPGNIVTAERCPFLAIDPKGVVGHIGYDLSVFLNNLHWWQKDDDDVSQMLKAAAGMFAEAFSIPEREIREWAYAGMVIGAWWKFEDTPDEYDADVALADIWDV